MLSEKGITIRFWKANRDILQANKNRALLTNAHVKRKKQTTAKRKNVIHWNTRRKIYTVKEYALQQNKS
jgi:hypothetical protein